MISTIYDFIQPIGLTLALCFALVEMIEAVTRSGSNNVTVEVVIMPLIKFGIAYLIIANGIEIISTILSGSNAFCDWVDSQFGAVDDFALTDTSLTVNGILAKILLEYIPSFISLLSQIIAALVVGVQLISIRLEVLVRAMFFPIAVADISGRGAYSGGMRYVKNFLGNLFLLGTILIVIKLTYYVCVDLTTFSISGVLDSWNAKDPSGMASNLFSGVFSMIFNGLIGPFACISAISTVKSMIREAFAG